MAAIAAKHSVRLGRASMIQLRPLWPRRTSSSAVRPESNARWSPRAGAVRWNCFVVVLLLPLATYGAYALTRDLLQKRALVEADVGQPTPVSNVPQPEPARDIKSRPPEIQSPALPSSRELAADSNLPQGAVIVMSFEESSFYERDGNTYVRNSSGQGTDALCHKVGFTAEGKCGGGLECQGGRLLLRSSFVNRQPNYTITLWCRCDDLSSEPNRIYASFRPGRPDQRVFDIGFPPERNLHVNAWNRHRKPDWWKSAATEPGTIPPGWCFLAITLENGGTDTGALTITIDHWHYKLGSQMVDTDDPQLADWLGGASGAVIDELAVFQRALSEQEIADIRSLGLHGTHLASGGG